MVGDQGGLDWALAELGLSDRALEVRVACRSALARQGDLEVGLARLASLRLVQVEGMDLGAATPRFELAPGPPSLAEIESTLRSLGPWRKGPFLLARPECPDVLIDAEWRSDSKWQRIIGLGVPFQGRRVLDVGTGNGYFLLRLLGARAAAVTGLEPSLRSVLQFLALRQLAPEARCSLLPLRLEDLPRPRSPWDVVLSMGVLYHQREPLEHLTRLRQLLVPGGDLVLETIVVPGPEHLHIDRGQRYAGMRNVYVIPTKNVLISWLERAGFELSAVGPAALTTSAEQRRTSWAEGPSLDDVLEPSAGDPDDLARRTREGHPRPARLMVWARAVESRP